jgi:hypothetical protein
MNVVNSSRFDGERFSIDTSGQFPSLAVEDYAALRDCLDRILLLCSGAITKPIVLENL